ncbi:MAG: YceI family protein [Desulfuromonadales bacterium]|nr:YceI family protein [Desulfuromonadales bacterium]
MTKHLLYAALLVLLSAPLAVADTFSIDPAHSQVHFSVRHMVMFNVRGAFTDFSGTIEADLASKTLKGVTATILTASIDTREKKRDEHLRSADFFDVANHPKMIFTLDRVVGTSDDLTIYGKLTIRGITKTVALHGKYLGASTDPWGNLRVGFEGTATVNRRDFGLTWNKMLEAGGYLVGDQVEIGVEIEAIKR